MRRRPGSALAALALAAAGVAICPPLATAATRPAPAPRSLTAPRVPDGVYFGIDPAFDTSEGTGTQAAAFTAETARPPAIVSYYIAWTQALPTDLATVSEAGAIPMISWKCGDADTSVAAGKDDSTIRALAEALKAFGRPVFLRWFWEMNLKNTGNHPQCLDSTTESVAQADYVQAWQHIFDVFQSVGASNVAFVWAPSAAKGEQPAAAAGFYPGNSYVDWIAADLYDRPGYGTFPAMFGSFYKTFSTAAYGKPMMLSETGAVGSTAQASWLKGLGSSLHADFPDIHGVVYVDAIDQNDYILAPGSTGLAEYDALAAEPRLDQYDAQVDTYGFATADGVVHVYDGYSFGDEAGADLPAKIVGFAEGPHGSGYWLTGADGSIYAFGSVKNLGSMRGTPLTKPIVAMAATPDARGYWLVASDGGMFAFGDAKYYGSMGGHHLNKPIVGMAATSDGRGYWLVASDGGMFAFGDAKFRGSMGGQHLNKPIDGMASTGNGLGYWLVASDGGIFTFGDAHFGGSLGGGTLTSPVVSAARDLVNGYYVVLSEAGTVFQFPGGGVVSTASGTSPAVQVATAPLY